MKALILGSSGQIGDAFVRQLQAESVEPIQFDIVNDVQQDLRIKDNPDLREKLHACDFVYFLAFDVGGSRYLSTYQHTTEFISNNTLLMEHTFSLLDETKKPFIFASSQMSNMSYSPYGVLKALGEAYTRAFGGLIVKFWNVYGVEHDLEKAHVITDFILKARNNKKIDMLTDGKELRQFRTHPTASPVFVSLHTDMTMSRARRISTSQVLNGPLLQVANIVAGLYPGTEIIPGKATDAVQQDKRNEPDSFILNFWKPKISIADGIKLVDQQTP